MNTAFAAGAPTSKVPDHSVVSFASCVRSTDVHVPLPPEVPGGVVYVAHTDCTPARGSPYARTVTDAVLPLAEAWTGPKSGASARAGVMALLAAGAGGELS